MFIKHCKIGIPGGGPLLVIRARSGRLDSGGDFGDCLPFADALSSVIFNGFEAIRDMSSLIRGFGLVLDLVPMLRH